MATRENHVDRSTFAPHVSEEIKLAVREDLERHYSANSAPVRPVRTQAEEGRAVAQAHGGGIAGTSQESLVIGGEALLDKFPAAHHNCLSVAETDCENWAEFVGDGSEGSESRGLAAEEVKVADYWPSRGRFRYPFGLINAVMVITQLVAYQGWSDWP